MKLIAMGIRGTQKAYVSHMGATHVFINKDLLGEHYDPKRWMKGGCLNHSNNVVGLCVRL